MEASLRPWFSTGVAFVGASAIALAPITPSAPSPLVRDVSGVSAAVSREFQLTALDIPYILTLPIVRQQIRNWAENWAVYLGGLAKAGVGAVQSLLSIPGVTVEVIQQVLALNFVGAFDTVTSAIRESVIAVGQPLLDSLIWRNQKYYAVETALQAAVPKAFIDVANGFLQAGNVVTTSLIVGAQDLVAAILSLNLGNIVNAAIDGTKNFIVALGQGAGAIIGGIESAQLGIATALATPPPQPDVADVSALRTLSGGNTFSLSSNAGTLDSVVPTQDGPTLSEADGSGVVDTVADPGEVDQEAQESDPLAQEDKPDPVTQDDKTVVADGENVPAKAETQDSPPAHEATDPAPASDPSHDQTPTGPKKKTVRATPIKDALKTFEKGRRANKGAGAEKDAGVDKGAVVKTDVGTDSKPTRDADGE